MIIVNFLNLIHSLKLQSCMRRFEALMYNVLYKIVHLFCYSFLYIKLYIIIDLKKERKVGFKGLPLYQSYGKLITHKLKSKIRISISLKIIFENPPLSLKP